MLRLDHLPFYGSDLAVLAASFEALGFRVSPPGAYRSPDEPGALWPARCVFLRRGWFDLLLDAGIASGTAHGPAACLYLAENLAKDTAGLLARATGTGYRLERRWDEDVGLPPEVFSLLFIRARAPLPLAVIEHPYPCRDTSPAWLDHPNKAEELLGVRLVGAAAELAEEALADVLDLSQLAFCSPREFERDFGPGEGLRAAVRIRVASLEDAASALRRDFRRTDERLFVPPASDLPCGFEFVAG